MTLSPGIIVPLAALLLMMTSCNGPSPAPRAAGEEDPGAEPAPPATRTLQEGERIVFLGDSITQSGVEPGGYVLLVDRVLREAYPGMGIEVIGAGISGNKVPQLLARLDEDVLAHGPTVVVVYIGINDVWHWFSPTPHGTEVSVYECGLRELIGRIRESGAGVVLCTPSVIGESPDFATEEDVMLEEYTAISRSVAAEMGVPLCDLRAAFREYLTEHNPEKLSEGILTEDGVHLNDEGNVFVAKLMLECLTGR